MPRAIWSGAISFGLVNIPVRLVTAVRRRSVRFREIRRRDSSRIRHRKVAAADGEEVSSKDIVKGYEIAPDRYVVVEPEELSRLEPEGTRTIDIREFVDLADIDPIYYDRSYYLVPAETAARPYRLLHAAMVGAGQAAVGRFVLRTRQHLAILRPRGGALAVATLVYHDEVVSPAALEGLPGGDVELDERELAMARQLIDSMRTGWDPERYHDEHRERVLALIGEKAEGRKVVTVPEGEREAGEVVDLMAALEASLAGDAPEADDGKSETA